MQLQQSGTKPDLVAKVLATKFGSFFYLYNALKNMLYHGSAIPHDWYMSFEKFGGLQTVVAFWEN